MIKSYLQCYCFFFRAHMGFIRTRSPKKKTQTERNDSLKTNILFGILNVNKQSIILGLFCKPSNKRDDSFDDCLFDVPDEI